MPLANRPLSMRKRTHFKYQASVSACKHFELLELGSTNYNKQEAQIVRLHELRVEPPTVEETSSTLEAPSAQEAAHTDSVPAERREVSGLLGEQVLYDAGMLCVSAELAAQEAIE